MSLFNIFLVGLLIGAAMVTPGVSGSVIAVILGVYEKAVDALINLFKNFKQNFIFLFLIACGIIVGSVWFSRVMLFLYRYYEIETKFCFIGLIIGGIPSLLNVLKQKNKKMNFIYFFICLIIAFFMSILNSKSSVLKLNNSFLNFFITGIIYSVGKVIPGISGSFLLIIIGKYDFVLKVISNPITYGMMNISKVLPFIAGLILGVLLLIKLTNYLLENFFDKTYSAIIGFIIGSIFCLVPSELNFIILLNGISFFIISFLLSYFLLKK